jgi:hypothetical protein
MFACFDTVFAINPAASSKANPCFTSDRPQRFLVLDCPVMSRFCPCLLYSNFVQPRSGPLNMPRWGPVRKQCGRKVKGMSLSLT